MTNRRLKMTNALMPIYRRSGRGYRWDVGDGQCEAVWRSGSDRGDDRGRAGGVRVIQLASAVSASDPE